MFTSNTVFILGAGASWHYGYPTGEGLVEHVVSMARRLSNYCQSRLDCGQVVQHVPAYVSSRIDTSEGVTGAKAGWRQVSEECQLLIDRLETVRPLVIDYFLAWNESLRPIGKLMIAAAILECEAEWLRLQANENRRRILERSPLPSNFDIQHLDIKKYQDDWYRFLVHKLVYGCTKSIDLLENKVRFISFNYDNSLEYHLFRALNSIDLVQVDAGRFLSNERIVHVYGSVHQSIPASGDAVDFEVAKRLGRRFDTGPGGSVDFGKEFLPRMTFLDRCLAAAENIRTIDPLDKEDEEASLGFARQWISDAEIVYVLGYGFDANNNSRIGLNPLSRPGSRKTKRVMYTNYGDTETISKRASSTFNGWNWNERSVRTVYEAIEKDFDALGNDAMPEGRI